MTWKYIRFKNYKCSKWISGDNWVTKFDDEKFCHIGINGKVIRSWMIESPMKARREITDFLTSF